MKGLLVHIGYHKTASSWLQQHLFNNHQCGFTSPFSVAEISNYLISPHALDFNPKECKTIFSSLIAAALSEGLVPVISSERLSGNPHSGGYDTKELADRLSQVFPKSRVLIVVREQKSMILSTYKQYVRTGGPCKLKTYLHPPLDVKIPLFSFKYFEYHRLIQYYMKAFGDERVLVLPFEYFVQSPLEFVGRIMEFSGLQAENKKPLPFQRKAARSLSGLSTSVKRPLNRVLVRNSGNPSALLDIPGLNKKVVQALRLADTFLPPRLQRTTDHRAKKLISAVVYDRYMKSNQVLSELVGYDLRTFGYDM